MAQAGNESSHNPSLFNITVISVKCGEPLLSTSFQLVYFALYYIYKEKIRVFLITPLQKKFFELLSVTALTGEVPVYLIPTPRGIWLVAANGLYYPSH